MTEKRFRTGKGIACGDYFSETIIDTKTNEKYYGGIKMNYRSSIEIVDLLNALHEENTTIKQTIKQAYNNEKTELGKSVLKQLINQME